MLVKRVGVLSAAKIAGGLYCALGLLAGAFVALASVVGAGFASANAGEDAPPAWAGALLEKT